jgi:hypothetical protein
MENHWVCLFREISLPAPGETPGPMGREAEDSVSETEADRRTGEICRAVLGRLFGGNGRCRGTVTHYPVTILYAEADAWIDAAGRPGFTRGMRESISRGSAETPIAVSWSRECAGIGGDFTDEKSGERGAVVRFNCIRRLDADCYVVEGNVRNHALSIYAFSCIVEKSGGAWQVKSSYRHWARRLRKPAMDER